MEAKETSVFQCAILLVLALEALHLVLFILVCTVGKFLNMAAVPATVDKMVFFFPS